MKQKQPKKLTKNQQLIKKYADRRPTEAQQKKALKSLYSKDADRHRNAISKSTTETFRKNRIKNIKNKKK